MLLQKGFEIKMQSRNVTVQNTFEELIDFKIPEYCATRIDLFIVGNNTNSNGSYFR